MKNGPNHRAIFHGQRFECFFLSGLCFGPCFFGAGDFPAAFRVGLAVFAVFAVDLFVLGLTVSLPACLEVGLETVFAFTFTFETKPFTDFTTDLPFGKAGFFAGMTLALASGNFTGFFSDEGFFSELCFA